MTWKTLLFIFTCFLMQNGIFGDSNDPSIQVKKEKGTFTFKCNNENWNPQKDTPKEFSLQYIEHSEEYTCENRDNPEKSKTITVRFRTCDSCIELDAPSLVAIIVGNLVTTFLIGYAVYSIVSQPKGKNFSGNKASDKVNLIPNGDRDTYQSLAPGQSSEYSRLGLRKN